MRKPTFEEWKSSPEACFEQLVFLVECLRVEGSKIDVKKVDKKVNSMLECKYKEFLEKEDNKMQ